MSKPNGIEALKRLGRIALFYLIVGAIGTAIWYLMEAK